MRLLAHIFAIAIVAYCVGCGARRPSAERDAGAEHDGGVQDGGADGDAGDSPGTDAGARDRDGGRCADTDGDGYGVGCAPGPDCDETSAACTTDCADADASGTVDCHEPIGAGVLLYNGAGGGAHDIYENQLEALYERAGYAADQSDTVPADVADRYGVLLVLSPTEGFAPELVAGARSVLARGGRVVLATEHSTYADHSGASAFLAAIGSSMRSIASSNTGDNPLTVSSVPPFTDGVDALSAYYSASVDFGSGSAIGTTAEGEVAIAIEHVLAGDVLVIADGSFFGYYLDAQDNSTFLLNIPPG